MAGKRKDSKGRILKGGESQRKNGTYEFRFTDVHGKRRSVYAPTLDELRGKENYIQRSLADGIDFDGGRLTVMDLVERYLATKTGKRHGTQISYNFVVNVLKKYPFSQSRISAVKLSDAKLFFLGLHEDGYSRSSISTIRSVLKPGFAMAVEEDLLRKNPFDFSLRDIIKNDAVRRNALTPEQQKCFFEFLQSDKVGSRYYDQLLILLDTGMRVSELFGLTKADVDLQNNTVCVNKQLLRKRLGEDRGLFVEETKTAEGNREIFLLPEAREAFQRVLKNRKAPQVEYIVDGYSGFLFIDGEGKPRVAYSLEHALERLVKRYNKTYCDSLILTPHCLRHTFATRILDAGIGIKDAQYLMGHANSQTTLNIYAHASHESAARALEKIGTMNGEPDMLTPDLRQFTGKLREVK